MNHKMKGRKRQLLKKKKKKNDNKIMIFDFLGGEIESHMI